MRSEELGMRGLGAESGDVLAGHYGMGGLDDSPGGVVLEPHGAGAVEVDAADGYVAVAEVEHRAVEVHHVCLVGGCVGVGCAAPPVPSSVPVAAHAHGGVAAADLDACVVAVTQLQSDAEA